MEVTHEWTESNELLSAGGIQSLLIRAPHFSLLKRDRCLSVGQKFFPGALCRYSERISTADQQVADTLFLKPRSRPKAACSHVTNALARSKKLPFLSSFLRFLSLSFYLSSPGASSCSFPPFHAGRRLCVVCEGQGRERKKERLTESEKYTGRGKEETIITSVDVE